MGMPIKEAIPILHDMYNYYNDGYCRLHHKENIEEQNFCNRWRGKEFTFDYGNDD